MAATTSTGRGGRLPIRGVPPRIVLTIGLLAWGIGEAVGLDGSWPVGARIAFVVAVLAPVAANDRWPWPVVAILLAGTAVEIRADVLYQSVSPMQGIVIAGWVAGATLTDRRRSIAGLVVVTALAILAADGTATFGVAVACALGWAGARATLGVRVRRADALRVLRAARQAGGELRRSEIDAERHRLARELDAAVLRAARRIGADARRAEAVLARDPVAAKAELRAIAETVRDAMRQMRQALAVLRPDGDDHGSPQPDGLATTIAALRDRGIPVAVHDHGADDEPATALATARILEIVARSAWRPRRIALRRTAHGARIRWRSGGPVTADERLALTRSAERARLHSGTVRVRRTPRPWDRRARTTTVRIPVLTRTPRRRPGPAGIVAGVIAAAATAADVATGHSLPVLPGTEPTALAIAASSLLTGVAAAAAWTRRTVFLCLLALVAFVRSWIVGFVGLDATTLPLLALTAFVTPLWLRSARRQWLVAGALLATSAAIVLWAWTAETNGSDLAIITASIGVPWAIAAAVRDAADDASRLTVLRWATARDDLIAAQRAVDDERRRVARDLHDLVGHGLSLVSVQAWGAERALPHDVERARQGITAIRRVVSSAVSELERLVVPWEEEAEELADVIDEARRSGLPVTLDADGALGDAAPPWPEPVATALRRVVQESLTNVVRHAGVVETTVRIRRDGPAIHLEVVNALGRPQVTAGPSGGMGIPGMRERIEALGGAFAAERRAGRFVVTAQIPLVSADGDAAASPGTSIARPERHAR
ncbi:MAG: hypothetical protein ITG02_05645 [Patulibacter sp.]|nr:hypothetical protein [Patulibacter sp.]